MLLRILICSSEVAPFAKTGGLADVVGALAPELTRRGHDVRVVLPLHGSIDRQKWDLKPVVPTLATPIGQGETWCAVHEGHIGKTPVYFVEHEQYFSRKSLYQWDGEDYNDNAERFTFFSRVCLQLCKAIRFAPDVVHCHDWQTGLIPIYLKTWEADHPLFWSTASVMTIHNLGYQGTFAPDEIRHTQLGWERFRPDGLEFYGKLNFLKGGILYADKVSTVSPNYAREIQTPEHGWGLDGVLRDRESDLVGILNGLDYDEWNPAIDKMLPATFDVDNLAGKAICKQELQKLFDLSQDPEIPLVGMVTRLAYQKGVDVLAAALPRLMALPLQFVTLGSGEIWSHFVFGDLPKQFPLKAGAFIGYDDRRAHLVQAGSDFFLMPSRYEPCGLSQLSSKRYGSIPIVRNVGGLEDTVENYDEATGAGDGFKFHDLTPDAIVHTVEWAVSTYIDRKHHLADLRDRGMKQRFLWSDSAGEYENLFQQAVNKKRQ